MAIATVMLVTVPAASALADARIRLVDAAGGVDSVQLEVSAGGQAAAAGGALAFGQAGEYTTVPDGEAELTLTGGSMKASATESLEDGASYTVVALPKGGKGLQIQVLRSGRAKAGDARLRVLHAAPELGSPDIRIGERTVAQKVAFRTATSYITLRPRSYELAVTKPDGGDAIFSKQISLAAGTASTVVLAGSGGAETQAIMVDDATVTPGGPPETGLGGLAGENGAPWALALLAALAAGTLGGALQLTRSRRSHL